ncbi:MAG: DUF4358 domain-containing protein [Oscillospiraceae bacterium]|nr:DUF4358 domain-containing protein [Oscillospiraceae bacterium]
MKKTVVIALLMLSVLLILLTTACGEAKTETVAEITVDTEAFLKKIEQTDLFVDTLGSTKESVLSQVMFLSTDKIESASLFMGTGFTGEAYAYFKCTSAEDAAIIVEELKTFVEDQKDIYISYAPDAIPHFDSAIIKQKGSYVAYVVADKNIEANRIVEEFFN